MCECLSVWPFLTVSLWVWLSLSLSLCECLFVWVWFWVWVRNSVSLCLSLCVWFVSLADLVAGWLTMSLIHVFVYLFIRVFMCLRLCVYVVSRFPLCLEGVYRIDCCVSVSVLPVCVTVFVEGLHWCEGNHSPLVSVDDTTVIQPT